MSKATVTIGKDNATIVRTYEDRDGQAQWSMHPQQIDAHLRGSNLPDHPFAPLSKGDRDALRDAHNEWHKQAKS